MEEKAIKINALESKIHQVTDSRILNTEQLPKDTDSEMNTYNCTNFDKGLE